MTLEAILVTQAKMLFFSFYNATGFVLNLFATFNILRKIMERRVYDIRMKKVLLYRVLIVNSRAWIYKHLKKLKYTLKYAFKILKICTKKLKYAKICTQNYFKFCRILVSFCKILPE